ncbi:hypothetical protein V1503_19315 [Bacillus sp. SCS-151]|uniref:DUF7446 family protein n=1 Tax=Nanhaiella sioensis TaxID=3115293 RepID=UPI00397D9B65
MGIKWSDIKVLNSPMTNNLYIGKVGTDGRTALDKSEDRTEEIKAAIMAHMDRLCIIEKTDTIKINSDAGTLTWKRKSK